MHSFSIRHTQIVRRKALVIDEFWSIEKRGQCIPESRDNVDINPTILTRIQVRRYDPPKVTAVSSPFPTRTVPHHRGELTKSHHTLQHADVDVVTFTR